MSESYTTPPEPEQSPSEHSLEQMVADLYEYEVGGQYPADLEFDSDVFLFRFGYPDPRLTAWDQRNVTMEGGDFDSSDTTEQKAVDVYNYIVETERAAARNESIAPFEEMYGYPDPRQTGPDATGR